ncbi:glycoside hydrolase family 3 protein [Hamadaea tsunoensis]|uniref:glycoside hydrolase family 3 protein n=1 Tax=Hamadaea tsunoensis TaxID=53368 RepID=UPI00054E8379|nr:glycoside hydrolase family 3 protein [Hamadaea tsunoensis]
MDESPSPRSQVEGLVAQLSVEEKLALLHQHQPAIERLGLARFTTGTEALHGLAWLGEATVFPQAVGLGATWDPALVRQVGDAVGDEVRGLHHKDPARCGLNVWAPVVNPLRDPRWGRNEEGYAEDPLLTGVLGDAYAWGLRGDHPRYLKTAPTLKHFLGYNNETDRCTTSSDLTPRVLHEYELPAYRPAIASGSAVAVMASYNLVNGLPAHVTPLINEQLRTWTADEIFVVSDAYAPSNLADPAQQAFYPDHATSHAAALRAGIDSFTDADNRSHVTIDRLREALQRGLITESDLDTAVTRALLLRARLGEFADPAANPYAQISADVINSPEHQRLALAAARASIVLLKSECKLLPLATTRTLAVIGPLAGRTFTDWYSGTLPGSACASRQEFGQPGSVTIKDGLASTFDTVRYAEGVDRVAFQRDGRYLTVDENGARLTDEVGAFDVFDWGHGVVTLRSTATGRFLRVGEDGTLDALSAGPSEWVVREMFTLEPLADGGVHLRHHASPGNPELGGVQADLSVGTAAVAFEVELLVDGAAQAATLALQSDAAVVVLGNHPLVNGRETEDRRDLALPESQDHLLREVYAANSSTALVLVSSYPYAVTWAEIHLPAVLWTSHGGQEMGTAVAEVLSGRTDPGGRLPQTWYRSAGELPDILDYDIIANDATYQYYRGTPLYPFGHGLSYADFAYENLRLSADSAGAGETVEVTLTVTNLSARTGSDVVQLYTHQQRSRVKQPLRKLRDFRKITLGPGASAEVTLTLRADDLAFWDVTTDRPVVEAARHKIMVGRSSADVRLTATLGVRGTVIGTRRAVDRPIATAGNDEYCGVTLAGDGVRAAEDGAWLCFQGVDLSGVRTTRLDGHGGRVTLRVDDPFAGTVLAQGVPGQSLVSATVDGVHDLYVIFSSAGTEVSSLRFGGTAA